MAAKVSNNLTAASYPLKKHFFSKEAAYLVHRLVRQTQPCRQTLSSCNSRQAMTCFLDYRIPVASDLPMIEAVIVEVPNPNHPFGVKGAGEVSIVPAVRLQMV